MNNYQVARKSADEIWNDILDRPVMGAFLKDVNATIRIATVEDWALIIKANIDNEFGD